MWLSPLDGVIAPAAAAWHTAGVAVQDVWAGLLQHLPPWLFATLQRLNGTLSIRVLARYFQLQQLCTSVRIVDTFVANHQRLGFLLVPSLAVLWACGPPWMACAAHLALALGVVAWWPALLAGAGLLWAAYDEPLLGGMWAFLSLRWLEGSVPPVVWLMLELPLATLKCAAAVCAAGLLVFFCGSMLIARLQSLEQKSSPAVASFLATWLLVRLYKGSALLLLFNTNVHYILPFACAMKLLLFQSRREFLLNAALLLLWGFNWPSVVAFAYSVVALGAVFVGAVLELGLLVPWRANHPSKWTAATILSSLWTACFWCGAWPPTLYASRCLMQVLSTVYLLSQPNTEIAGEVLAGLALSLQETFVAVVVPALACSYVGYRRHRAPPAAAVDSATPLLGEDPDLEATPPRRVRSMSAVFGRSQFGIHRTFSSIRRTHSAADTLASDLEIGSRIQPTSLPPRIQQLARQIVDTLPFDFDFEHLETGATVQEDTTFTAAPSFNTKRRGQDLGERLPPAVREWKLEQGPARCRLVLRHRDSTLRSLWALLENADKEVIDFLALRAFGGPRVAFEVDRADLLSTGLTALKAMDSHALLASEIGVTFKEESGVDAGGLRREFFTQFALQLTDVNRPGAIFAVAADNSIVPQPTTAEDPPPDLEAYRLAGRFFGLTIMQGYSIPVYFHGIIYKMMTRHRVTLRDVKSLNPEFFHHRFETLLQPDGVSQMEELLCEELTFVSAVTPGQPVPVPLVEGGEARRVTEDNKREYLELLATQYVEGGVHAQRAKLLEGFHEVIPIEVLRELEVSPRDLEVILAGCPDLDLEEWKAHTTVEAEGEREQQVTEWFWECVQDMDAEQHSRLLAFTTGLRRLPPSGFCGLSFKLSFDVEASHLPTAHTCFQNLVLPLCESKEDLMAKLKVVLQDDAMVGFGFV
eukprot:EG_transcript_2290